MAIQLKRGKTSSWSSKGTTTLKEGQPAVDIETGLLKFGKSGGGSWDNAVGVSVDAGWSGSDDNFLNKVSWSELSALVKKGPASQGIKVGQIKYFDHSDFGMLKARVIGIDHDTVSGASHSITMQLVECIPGTYIYENSSSNTWSASEARAWLNQDTANKVDEFGNLPGFIYGLDPELKKVLGTTSKQCIKTYNATTLETVSDKIFLLSCAEVYAGKGYGSAEEGKVYDYYKNNSSLSAPGTGSDTNRIRFTKGSDTSSGSSGTYWWLRTPHSSNSHAACDVISTGNIYNTSVTDSISLLPAFCII